ncbi:GNAT family N-acetyltransferase [Dongia sp.]|uniref:GNAT family N-acetyltransferase n=1 Tax=Dongia sp. TaxID=1977262 RepID=UPI0035B08679
MDIKAAHRSDLPALIALHDAAFGTPYEGRLVADLLAANLDAISLVASNSVELLGHILFSPLLVEVDGEAIAALALAPLAVMPGRQGQGVGTALMEAGLAQARAEGWDAVVVLGHPEYYSRFGFTAAALQGFAAPFDGPAFMALELRKGALSGRRGRIIYPAPFATTDAPAAALAI